VSIATLKRRLAAAWARFGVERRCAKGASRARLARAKALGAVPAELLAILAWHDGSRGRELDGYYRLLSCAEIVRHKRTTDSLVAEFEDAWMPGEWWSPDWIPFLEFNGDLVCVDGRGRVVSFKTHDARRTILHGSFRDWLATLASLWERMPEGASEDDQTRYFEGREARRIARAKNPGYPIARTARMRPKQKAPKQKAPKGIEYAREGFTRGPYEWRVERAGAMVRTYSGRGISRRYHVKTFPSVEKARLHMERQVRKKLREGYAREKKPPGRDEEFIAAALPGFRAHRR
jgi:cell wall assembly regulator SMI1